jgi:hypothetical protein
MFTIDTKSKEYAKEKGCGRWDYYDTDEFYAYMDQYAEFVKKHKAAIDLYANCDAIGNPEISWRNQRYLEREHGLDPVPVVHQGTDLSWLAKYIDRGRHEVIGLGWLTQGQGDSFFRWLDSAFKFVCRAPSYHPVVKLHGFGVTGFTAMLRYPWWSVDSATWTKVGAFGGILIPHKRDGRFVYNEQPYVMQFSDEAPTLGLAGKHYGNLRKTERKIVLDWLAEINVPLGETDIKTGEPITLGVTNHHSERKIANLIYFERFREQLPEWPWPFRAPVRRTTLTGD